MKVWKKFWVMARAFLRRDSVERVELLPSDKNHDDSKPAPAAAAKVRGGAKKAPPPRGRAVYATLHRFDAFFASALALADIHQGVVDADVRYPVRRDGLVAD
ncbi:MULTISPECIES: hypothetical protein [unclassified Janthinobacterium]|uniref:hypothetical protein n=1 Tax=unclassified Janthinobacterium TaxID=2610881 RepID=UPI0012F86B85|nr:MULTISPECIES: hypothetical protein [unclassified Janthinobacterium]MEC5163449.1 hypothetical protein [Janthinobacterium sp. CG_S6]